MAQTVAGVEGSCLHCGGSWYVLNGVCEDCAVARDPGPAPATVTSPVTR